jgi:hypothetical protein
MEEKLNFFIVEDLNKEISVDEIMKFLNSSNPIKIIL